MMENIIASSLKQHGPLHFTLIDPDKQDPKVAGEMAISSQKAGSCAIMIGGSTCPHDIVDEATKAIKQSCELPTILFPGSAAGLSTYADYIFFMTNLNSTLRSFLVGEQVKGAPFIKKSGLKPIPMGYLLISTSSTPTTVEKVSKPDPITAEDLEKAVAYALTSQYFGQHCVYLEAGSGAEKPVAKEIITAVKQALDIPIIVGGGIRSPKAAQAAVDAGADVVVTGTIAEKDMKLHTHIINAVKK